MSTRRTALPRKPASREMAYLVVALFFTVITLGTAATWYFKATTLAIAVGPAETDEAQFATHLARLLHDRHGPLRLRVLKFNTEAQAMVAFERRDADMTILRSDGHVPGNARALADLERNVVLVLTKPPRKGAPPFSGLTGKHITVLSNNPQDMILARAIATAYHTAQLDQAVHAAEPGQTAAQALAATGDGVLLAIEPISQLLSSQALPGAPSRFQGLVIQPLDLSHALERKILGLSAETIEAGLLSGDPRMPNDDMDSVAVHRLLVVRARTPEMVVGDLMHFLFENRADLAIENGFASQVEAPDTAKEARVPAHPAAAAYVDGDEQSFIEQYGDALYLAISGFGIFGSIGFTRRFVRQRQQPIPRDTSVDALYALRVRIRKAVALSELAGIEHELDEQVDVFLLGLSKGTISAKSIERFRVGHEHALRALEVRKKALSE